MYDFIWGACEDGLEEHLSFAGISRREKEEKEVALYDFGGNYHVLSIFCPRSRFIGETLFCIISREDIV